ncbi:hypothetical protein F5Y13DRAFT_68529 [Hypoxylon sp. FL1857]|nr:hypothetical protein F5Y13DRAFT_68529 [Hypoxylon sp. FL1857]
MASSPKPYSLQLAERIHNTTGKDRLGRICVLGIILESLWHSVVERKLLKTSAPVVRKALFKAAIFWPGVYVVTGAAVKWAELRVRKAEEIELETRRASQETHWD